MSTGALVSKPRPMVLLVGNLVQEGVTTKVQTLGYGYRQKLLYSKPGNWISILELLREWRSNGQLAAVFIHLTPSAIFRAAHQEYREIWESLLSECEYTRTVVLVYEDILAGKLPASSPFSELDGPYRKLVSESTAIQLVRELYDYDVEVAPYNKRIDLTVRIQRALDEIEAGIFFRLYVPRGRLHADQLASLIRLLEHYLRNVEGIAFSYDERRTEHGTVYIFKSADGRLNTRNLGDALGRFESFMQLAQEDTHKATQILQSFSIGPREASLLIARYEKEFRRVLLDVRHEYETRTLALRQRLETEILEQPPSPVVSTPDATGGPMPLFLTGNTGPITINLFNTNQLVNTNTAQIVQGDIEYTTNDRQLMDLFNRHTESMEQAWVLRSSLEQLKDVSLPQEERHTAKQKVQAFLYKVLPKIGEKAVTALIAYLIKSIAVP